jgi:Zn-dependent M16 (insulinase) family peptidase
MWNGVSQIKFLETLGDIQAVSESLETLLGQMFYGQASAMMISGQKQAEDRVALLCHSFKSPKPALNMVFSPQYEKKNHVMDLGVNFVSRIMKCVPYTHPDSSYLALLASILTNQYLHIELREKRGAYGGFSRYQPQTGIFAFMTYRDPIGYQRTLDVFKNSIEWLETTELELYLEKAKLDVIKGFDQPLDASQEGLLHLYGADLKKRQDFRDRILHANVKDLTIVIDYLKQKHVDVVLGESMDCIHNI